jgi:hypothetical protein
MISCKTITPGRCFALLAGLLVSIPVSLLHAQHHSPSTVREATISENRGQVVDVTGSLRSDIPYTATTNGAMVYFRENGPSFVFTSAENTLEPAATVRRIDLDLLGANRQSEILVEEQLPGTANYYLTHVPNGIHGVRSWRRLVYRNIYPNIDLVFGSTDAGMQAEFAVHPGGRLTDIAYRFVGGGEIGLDETGALAVDVNQPEGDAASVAIHLGVDAISTQEVRNGNGSQIVPLFGRVESVPVLAKAADDPTVAWATYIGGTDRDYGVNVTADIDGNVIVTGYTVSLDFPASPGAYQAVSGGPHDIFVAKFNATGGRRWVTYYGGAGSDLGFGVAVDRSSNILVGGQAGTGCPVTQGVAQSTYGGGDADGFVLKLNPDGTRVWATFYGGTLTDVGLGFTVDQDGNALLCGRTSSASFPTSPGAFQSTLGGGGNKYDAFLVKLNSSGVRQWATLYGGSDNDYSQSVAADSSGNIVIVGTSFSDNFPISPGAFQSARADSAGTFKATDGFVVRFGSDGARKWATYFGGVSDDFIFDVAVEKFGDAVVVGSTNSTDLPVTPGALQPQYADSADAFIARFSVGGERQWATYYGGTRKEDGSGLAIGSNGGIVVAGSTESTDLPVSSTAVQSSNGGTVDLFILQISSVGDKVWSSYFGGPGEDRLGIGGVGIDTTGNLLMTGNTTGNGFPVTSESFQFIYGGGEVDALLVKLAIAIANPPGSVPIINEASGSITLEALTPNPTRESARLRFRLAMPQSVCITVYASDGSRVLVPVVSRLFEAGEHVLPVDLQGLASGNYIIELQSPRGRGVASLVVTR